MDGPSTLVLILVLVLCHSPYPMMPIFLPPFVPLSQYVSQIDFINSRDDYVLDPFKNGVRSYSGLPPAFVEQLNSSGQVHACDTFLDWLPSAYK